MNRAALIAAVCLAAVVALAVASADADLYMDAEKTILNHEHADHDALFREFKDKFERVYDENSEEHSQRLGYFKDNLKRIKYLNDNDAGARYAITNFADMSDAELDAHQMAGISDAAVQEELNKLTKVHDANGAYTESRWVKDQTTEAVEDNDYDSDADLDEIVRLIEKELNDEEESADELQDTNAKIRATPFNKGPRPENYDWRLQDAVSHVKNQQSCGSCWAFAAIGNVEGLNKLYQGNDLTSLSEQNLVDCDRTGENGCHGGMPGKAFDYLQTYPYLLPEKYYPYASVQDQCKFRVSKSTAGEVADEDVGAELKQHAVKITVKDQIRVGPNEDSIADFLYHHGPLAAALHGRGWLHFYHSGVANPPQCPDNITHGVVLVGYGVDNGKKYWLYKNSWGPVFGENGFFRLERGAGVCAMNKLVQSALPAAATEMGYDTM